MDQRSRSGNRSGASLGGLDARKFFSGGVGVYASPSLAHAWELGGILNLLRKQVSTKVSE